MTSGFETYVNEPSVASYDTIDWSINCLYAMQADSALFDQYYDIFTVFYCFFLRSLEISP